MNVTKEVLRLGNIDSQKMLLMAVVDREDFLVHPADAYFHDQGGDRRPIASNLTSTLCSYGLKNVINYPGTPG